jgi:phosphatidylglycerophosphate synthase
MVDKEPQMSAAATHEREKSFLLAGPEQRVLQWLAPRLPQRVMPDHLTALGVLAALGIAAAYVLSNGESAWLLVATALLGVHWLGDSLDGTLARVRRTERPTYGYYLDHLVDGLATAAIGIGLGLSPHMLLATGLAIVVGYLLLSINTYLETQAFGVFKLGYGRIGPTEARLALAVLNVILFAGVTLDTQLAGLGVSVLDVFGLVVAGGMVATLCVRAWSNLRVLAEREPAGKVRPA